MLCLWWPLQYPAILFILQSYATALCLCLRAPGYSQSLQISLMFIILTTINSTVLLIACYPSSCPLSLTHAVKKSNPCRKFAKEISVALQLFMQETKALSENCKTHWAKLALTKLDMNVFLNCQIVLQNQFCLRKFGYHFYQLACSRSRGKAILFPLGVVPGVRI